MTPEPPASPDGSSLPPRHRPSLERLTQDATEKDLWALEGEEDESTNPGAPRSAGREIPAPRERPSPKLHETEGDAESDAVEGGNQARTNASRPLKGRRSAPAKPENAFDDLEHWEDFKPEPETKVIADEGGMEIHAPVVTEEPEEDRGEAATADTSVPPPAETPGSAVPQASPGENAGPVSLRPTLGLSKVERIGLIVLLVLLVGGGATLFLSSLRRLPTESAKAESQDFPIKGEFVSITSAVSYWRAPIREGPDADTFRRGTELLPVVELSVSGGPAAIRVLFRSEDNSVVGDVVTRTVSGAELLKIPATAGFDDPGMHAAYSTGESKPWTIEVYESRSANALGKDFKKLFEMNISTDRR